MNAKKKSISSDLKKLEKMTDADIDYSDIPPLDESFFKKEIVKLPQKKDSTTLRIDNDVLEYFKHQGKGYQISQYQYLELSYHLFPFLF